MKLARPTAGSHASLHPSWKLAPSPNHCYPRASSRGTGLQVGSRRHETPRGRPRGRRRPRPPSIHPPIHPSAASASGAPRAREARPGEARLGRPTSGSPRERPRVLRSTPCGRAEQLAPLVPRLRTPRRRRAVRGRGKPGGRQGPGTRRRARRPRLSGPPPSRRPQGGPTRTPGDARRRKRGPFPSLAAPGPAGAPPVRLCGGPLDYVCPGRAAALAAGWRWGGRTPRRRRRRRWRGGGGSQQGHGS